MHKFKLLLTERQLHIIQEALELYARLKMGQIRQALWSLFISKDIDQDVFDEACRVLKTVIFPGLPNNAAAIPTNREGEDWQVAFEVFGVVRHELWKRMDNPPRHVVSADPPLQYSHEPLVIFEDVSEDPKPVDMLLYCPNCHAQHIDEPQPYFCRDCGHHHGDHFNAGERNVCAGDQPIGDEPGCDCGGFTAWLNPPHKSHRCHSCNHVWRPANVPTNGVEQI